MMQSVLDRDGYSSAAVHDPLLLEQMIGAEQPKLLMRESRSSGQIATTGHRVEGL